LEVAKDMKELFDFLVDSFSLSVGLGVKGHGKGLHDFEFFPNLSHQLGGKLRTSVRDDLVGQACSFPDLFEIEKGSLFGCYRFLTGGNNDSFTKAVDDYKHGVISLRFREVSNKVHCDGLPYAWRGDKRLQWDLGLWFDFGRLACGASIDIVVDKLGNSWPPEVA